MAENLNTNTVIDENGFKQEWMFIESNLRTMKRGVEELREEIAELERLSYVFDEYKDLLISSAGNECGDSQGAIMCMMLGQLEQSISGLYNKHVKTENALSYVLASGRNVAQCDHPVSTEETNSDEDKADKLSTKRK
jgi:hypothetical protein